MLLLNDSTVGAVAKQFGFDPQVVGNHLRKHLPWRSRRAPRPQTVLEELELMDLELRRLMILAECGQSIGGAIQALTSRRAVLELKARLQGGLDATHRKLALASRAPEGDFEVVFEGGRAKTQRAGGQ